MSNFETIKLDKGLYETNKGFTAELESIDPSENYKGTSLEGLDAFERQLKRFDIKVSGTSSSNLERFFQTTDSAVLFPEYVYRAVQSGIRDASLIKDIVATVSNTNSLTHHTLLLTDTNNTSEPVPSTDLKVANNFTRLYKRGRKIVASYEALRLQQIDLFTVVLRQIGAYIARAQFNDAMNVIIDGDGDSTPAKKLSTFIPGLIRYSDLINLWNEFTSYNLNTLIAAADIAPKLLMLPEIRDTLTYKKTGEIVLPFGATFLKTGALSSSVVALDKSCALEMIVAGDLQIDYNKLIDKQFEHAAITLTSGFAKIFPEASKLLVI